MRWVLVAVASLVLTVGVLSLMSEALMQTLAWKLVFNELLPYSVGLFIAVVACCGLCSRMERLKIHRALQARADRLRRHAGYLSAAAESLQAIHTTPSHSNGQAGVGEDKGMHRQLVHSLHAAVRKECASRPPLASDPTLMDVEIALRNAASAADSVAPASAANLDAPWSEVIRGLKQQAVVLRSAASLISPDFDERCTSAQAHPSP